MTTVVSLRKFSRIAPGLAEVVLILHNERIIGEFTPAGNAATAPSVPAATVDVRRISPAPKSRVATPGRGKHRG